MDRIIHALERVKEISPADTAPAKVNGQAAGARYPTGQGTPVVRTAIQAHQVEIAKIIAHDHTDVRSKSFDILRTQLLQTMEANQWRVLGITSATPGAGKTFTALNLAVSVARIPDVSVLLVDMDLRKPQVATRLGLKNFVGLRGVLDQEQPLQQAIAHVSVGDHGFAVLPTERGTARASDVMKSPEMATTMRQLKSNSDLKLIIFDLPPVFAGDEVISILPFIDCVLLVAAAGTSTKTEVKECAKYLGSTPVARIVLNKVPQSNLPAYYY